MDINQEFYKLNSQEKTKVICELIKENASFIDIRPVIDSIVDAKGLDEITDIFEDVYTDHVF